MPPKLSPARTKNLLNPRFSEAAEILEIDITAAPASGTLSPNGSKTPNTTSSTVANVLTGHTDLNDQIIELKSFVLRANPKYVVYNEIARLQYQQAQELLKQGKISDSHSVESECLQSIQKAKTLVSNNPSVHANTKSKSIVYYNHSQFNTAFYLLNKSGDKTMLTDALISVNQAIDIVDKAENRDYYQDYLVHKAFIMPYVGQIDESKTIYADAFRIDPSRFVAEYTSRGTGKELMLFIIANDMDGLMKELVELKCDTIDPNALTDMGLSLLQFAVQSEKKTIASQLLKLGADPLYRSADSEATPLTEALSKGLWSLAEKMLKTLAEQDRIKDIDFPNLQSELEISLDDTARSEQNIQKLFGKYNLKLPHSHDDQDRWDSDATSQDSSIIGGDDNV